MKKVWVHRAKALFLIAAVFLVLAWLGAGTVCAETKGLFIGTASYTQPGCNPLPDTRFDANDMYNSMIGNGIVRKNNADMLTGRNTKNRILGAIRNQARNLGPNDTLIIYNSSHGSSAGTLCASDADITPAEMRAAIESGGVGNVVIINDSCHSEKFQVNVPGRNIAHINAAEADNVAFSSTGNTTGMGHKNGVLTRQILEGLKNNRADINGDGKITTKEIAAFARVGSKYDESKVTRHDYDNTQQTQGPNHKGDGVTLVTGKEKKPDQGDDDQSLMPLVPQVVGKKKDVALAMLAKDKLTGTVLDYAGDKVKNTTGSDWVGHVISCVPKAGTRIAKGTSVNLYVPKKEDLVKVPLVLGLKASDAAKAIMAVGLTYKFKRAGRVGSNISHQEPVAGTKLVKGSTVYIEIGDPGQGQRAFCYWEHKKRGGRDDHGTKVNPYFSGVKAGKLYDP